MTKIEIKDNMIEELIRDQKTTQVISNNHPKNNFKVIKGLIMITLTIEMIINL